MKNYLFQLIIGLFILTFAPFCDAQSEFLRLQQQIYTTSPKNMVQLADSGYLVVENYSLSSSMDQTFKRTDKFGSVLWYKRASLSGDEFSMGVMTTSTKRMVSATHTPINNTFGVLFMDSLGTSISHKRFGFGTTAYEGFKMSLAESPDKKVYALGTDHLVKMDSVGNVIWQKRYLADNINLIGVHPISSSKLILTGFAANVLTINSNYDIVQICIDSAGTILWSKIFGSCTQELPAKTLYENGKIYHIGSIDHYSSGRGGGFIFCTDTVGTQLWCKWIDSRGYYNWSVVLKDGTIASLNNNNNVYSVVRFTEDGDFISGTKLNSPLGFYVRDMIATKDGGVYMEAEIGANSNVYGIKLASNLYPDCIPVLPYTPDSMFNQVFDEAPFICTALTYTTVSNMNPSWTNLPFSSTAVCAPTCNVVASFKPDKTHVCQGETSTFTNNSAYATSYQWFLGSTLVSSSPSFSHTFSTSGEYRVKLVASNGTCTDSAFTRVLVSAPLPQPAFTHQKDHFKGWFNTVVPPFSSATWNFGDGTGMQMHIDSLVHNFKSAGTYPICLTEKNVCGTVSVCENITFAIDSTYEFIKHYNEDSFYNGNRWAQGAQALYGGGFILSGTDDTWGSTGYESTLVKTDKKGNPIWTQILTEFASGSNIQINHITETHKGYLLLAGTNLASPYIGIMDSSGRNTYMLRVTNGAQGSLAGKPYERTNGRIVFTGCFGGQAFITETDLALGIYWYKKHTAIQTHYGTAKTTNGFLMVGTDLSNTQMGFLKVNETGDYVSSRSITIAGSSPTAARDIAATPDGNYIVTGNTGNQLFLMKIDSDGTILWTKKYDNGVSSLGYGLSISVDNAGNIRAVSSGKTVLKTDPSGNVLWAWKPPGASVYGSVRHAKTLDDGLIVAGTVDNYFDSPEIELSLYRFNNSGNMPTCTGTSMLVTATPVTATSNVATDVQTSGAPAFNKFYSDNLYASYQAEICASGASSLNAAFAYGNTCSGIPVQFNNTSAGAVVSHSWSFQGGLPAVSTSVNPSITWNTPGTYAVSLTVTAMDGGTSTETQNITINAIPTVNAGMDLGTCPGDSIVLNGSGTGTLSWNPSPSISNPSNAITTASLQADEVFVLNANSGNCPMSDTVLVTVYPEYAFYETATICSGASYTYHGQTYTVQAIYFASYTTVNGCDSIYTFELNVNPPFASGINATICEGETYTVGSSVFSTSGNYVVPFQTQAGCDSNVVFNLTVLPANDIGVTVAGNVLTANQSGANYVWFNCVSQQVVGTGQSFTPTVNGNYAVIVTANNCADTSLCYAVTDLATSELSDAEWSVYPVPSNNLVYLVSPAEWVGEHYQLYDPTGRVVQTGLIGENKTVISLEPYPVGVYQLKVTNGGQIFQVIRQ